MELKDKVISLYKQGYSTRSISNLSHITRYRVNKYIKDSGEKIRNLSESHKKFKYIEDYFSIIDTERKAYFLGLLYADGNICIINRKRLQITLKNEDKYILEELLKELGDGNLYRDGLLYSKIIIHNDKLVEDLINLGCTPRKSLTLKFYSNTIPVELVNHFIRGYFDGDGSVGKLAKKGYVVSFSGMELFLKDMLELCPHILFSKFYPRYKNKFSAGSMNYYDSYKKGFIFFNYLYKNATIYMKRKYLKMKKIIDANKDI